MEIARFDKAHIERFLTHAKIEGWITTRSEIEFLLKSYPCGCLACIHKGLPVGFITSIRYVRSAWIGNLLVIPSCRGRGIGRLLMQSVLNVLDASACETVWLTASADGEHLYRTLGFRQIDVVRRWKGAGYLLPGNGSAEYCETISKTDSAGWGDERLQILDALAEGYRSFTSDNGFIVSSFTSGMQHIGPWGAISEVAATELFSRVRAVGSGACEAVLDVPATNRSATKLLVSSGFTVFGTTLLMCRGTTSGYNPDNIFALASLGSYG